MLYCIDISNFRYKGKPGDVTSRDVAGPYSSEQEARDELIAKGWAEVGGNDFRKTHSTGRFMAAWIRPLFHLDS